MKTPIVKNLTESVMFYRDILQLELLEQYEDCIRLRSGEHDVIMFEGTKGKIDYQHGYNVSSTLVFCVENLNQRIGELKSQGVEFIHASPNQNRWGRYSAFTDPSGIVHELFEAN